jgi:hypothetical protein
LRERGIEIEEGKKEIGQLEGILWYYYKREEVEVVCS